MANKALIPLNIAEFLRVTLALAKQSHTLDTETKKRIGMVLALYETGRDEHLLNNGYTQQQINGMANSASLALANYFEDKAQEVIEGSDMMELPHDDFDMDDFERQFDGDHHQDPN